MSTGAERHDDEAAEIRRLQANMAAAEMDVDAPALVHYVQATLAFGMANVRTEFRPLARRNWRLIRQYGRRASVGFAVLFVTVAFFGWRAEHAGNVAASAARKARAFAHESHTLAIESHRLAVKSHALALANSQRIAEAKALRTETIKTTCREANEHHVQAAGFVAQLVAKSAQPTSRAELLRREQVVPLFVEAIAPRCTHRQLRERLTKR